MFNIGSLSVMLLFAMVPVAVSIYNQRTVAELYSPRTVAEIRTLISEIYSQRTVTETNMSVLEIVQLRTGSVTVNAESLCSFI